MIQTFTRNWDADLEIQRGGDGRTVTAYAAVFGQDAEIHDRHGHYIERIGSGAFTKTIKETPANRISVFYNHGFDLTGKPNMLGAVPIGTCEQVSSDGKGLLTVTRYNKTELGDAVLEAIRDGQIPGQSFTGRVYNSRTLSTRNGLKVIERTELGLKEYGPTYSPAYAGAGILAIRADTELADMIRSIIRAELTTSEDAGQQHSTPAREPESDESVTRHSGQILARRNALKARRILLGVSRAEAPDA